MWRPREVGEVFAERRFAFKRGGRSREVRLVVGRPVKGPEPRDPWWCPIHLSEPFDKFDAIAGEDSMQCLVLALELMNNTLPSLARQKGGRAEWLGEHERLVFAGSEASMWRWKAVENLVDGLADAVKQLEARKHASPGLLQRLRAVVASSGASTTPFRGMERHAKRRSAARSKS